MRRFGGVMRKSGGVVFVLAMASGCHSTAPLSTPPTVTPRTGAVVAEHPLAVKVGLGILDRGGNAADAAVATALALAVVYPQAGNLGGGGFALWVPPEGAPASYDFREAAPAAADPHQYLLPNGTVDPRRSRTTPMAVGVPGSPAGLEWLHERHGSGNLSFADLCGPAIQLAREGFRVDPWLVNSLERAEELLSADPEAKALFFPGGRALREGELWVQPALALTLERLAAEGSARGFYRGPVAEAIVGTLEQARDRTRVPSAGPDLGDLAGYAVVPRQPMIGWFQGQEVISMGPPSSGGLVLLQTLSMLEGMPLAAERTLEGEPTARAYHWWIEALRRAFADRAMHLGDPDHYEVPVEELLDPSWIARRRISIGERANLAIAAWEPAPGRESSETTHLSVLDDEGNAVSLTTTLNASFGSGIVVEDWGFLLNNELDDFSIQPGVPNMYGLVGSEANQLRARRRPLSSMTPTVVREGGRRVRLVVGAPGGPRIITSVFQVVLRVLFYGQSLEDAVAAPRLHQQWKPESTRFERAFDPGEIETLRTVHGQPVTDPTGATFGSIQAIAVDEEGRVHAVSDPRRGGIGGVQGHTLPTAPRPR